MQKLNARERWSGAHLISLIILGLMFITFGCGELQDETVIGVKKQALDSDHTRVIHECSQAISGSWWTYDETDWPTGTTYGSYAYISNDTGAWGLLLDNTYNGSVRGWWTSCRSTYSPSVVNYNNPPCQMTYGDLDTASLYDCQGSCASATHFHGGQCKPFMNLVAYRSGLYQNPNYAWKSFPSDDDIDNWSTDADEIPWATYNNIEPGDYLRRTDGHALIILRKIDSSNVVVLDSNWVNGGDGYETIGSHVLGFSGTGNNNLGNYRVLKCAYNGNC